MLRHKSYALDLKRKLSLTDELSKYTAKMQSLLTQHGEKLIESLRKVTVDNNGYVYDLDHISFYYPLPGEPYLYLELRYYPSGELRMAVNRKHMYGLMKVFRPLAEEEGLDEQKLHQLVSITIHRISEELRKVGIQ